MTRAVIVALAGGGVAACMNGMGAPIFLCLCGAIAGMAFTNHGIVCTRDELGFE